MTTYAVSSTLSNASTAAFDAWVNEIFSAISTNCGLPQLSALMDTGQMAVPTTTAVPAAADTSAGYYMFAFNDTLSQGPLIAAALVSPQAGTNAYANNSGTWTGVALSYTASGGLGGTAGTGSGAIGTVVLTSGGLLTSITVTTVGAGYLIGDELTFTNAAIAAGTRTSGTGVLSGTGAGAAAFVNQVSAAASPVVIRLDFGSGSAAGDPQMAVSVGTSWTSAGVLGAANNGHVIQAKTNCLSGQVPISTTVNYNSYYCYNSTYGHLLISFKYGGTAASSFAGTLIITRAIGSNGLPISNSVTVLTTLASVLGTSGGSPASSANGYIQIISYTANNTFPVTAGGAPTVGTSNMWGIIGGNNGGTYTAPFALTGTNNAGTVYVFPVYTYDPVIRILGTLAFGFLNDIPVGDAASLAVVGASALTFLQLGPGVFNDSSGFAGITFATMGLLALYQ